MKFLIIQLRQLGDVLLSACLLKAIKEHINDAQVDFLTSCAAKEILTLNPNIHKVLTMQKGLLHELSIIKQIRANAYDSLIDAQRTATTKRIAFLSKAKTTIAFKGKDNFYYNTLVEHEINDYTVDDRLTLLKPLGIKAQKGKYLPELYYDKHTQLKIDSLLGQYKVEDKFFVVMPTARKKVKSWPQEHYAKLIDMLSSHIGYTPVVVVSPNEEAILKNIQNQTSSKLVTLSSLSIKELACLIQKSKFFVGNDSFGAHIAVSQKTKAFVLIGFSSGWYPNNNNTIKIAANLPCQPCNDWKSCPYEKHDGYLKCFNALEYKTVFEVIKSHIG